MQSILDSDQPQQQPQAASPGGGSPVLAAIAGVLAVIGLGLAIFLFVRLKDARAQIGALEAKVSELSAASASNAKATRALDGDLAAVKSQTAAVAERVGMTEAELEKTATAARQLREQQRKDMASLGGEVGKVKEDLAASQAAIAETQAKLQRAVGDLGEQSGLIARNADELAALKRAGLREYFDFDLKKAKQSSPVGPVAIRLKDADAKRHKFNLVLVVDDLEIEKKDKTLLEPVQFYRKGSRQLHEIVVFTVAKDRVVGYLSTPKPAEAAAQ